jgi:hypothetical protein
MYLCLPQKKEGKRPLKKLKRKKKQDKLETTNSITDATAVVDLSTHRALSPTGIAPLLPCIGRPPPLVVNFVLESSYVPLFPYVPPKVDHDSIEHPPLGFVNLCRASPPIFVKGSDDCHRIECCEAKPSFQKGPDLFSEVTILAQMHWSFMVDSVELAYRIIWPMLFY